MDRQAPRGFAPMNADDFTDQGPPEKDTIIVEDEVLSEGFTQVPNILLKRVDLSHGAKIAYAMLLSYAWGKDRCFPGQDVLARDMGVERKAVIRYLKELKDKGIVTVQRRGMGKTNVYTLPRLRDVPKMGHQEVPQLGHAVVPPMGHKEYSIKKTKKEEEVSNIRNGVNRKLTFAEGRNGAEGSEANPAVHAQRATAPEQLLFRARPSNASGSDQAARPATEPTTVGETLKRRGRSPASAEDREVIVAYLADFAREMNDQAPLRASTTRALNLLTRSGLPRNVFLQKLYEARSLTTEHSASIQKTTTRNGSTFPVKAKMAYFFAVLEDLCGLKDDQAAAAP